MSNPVLSGMIKELFLDCYYFNARAYFLNTFHDFKINFLSDAGKKILWDNAFKMFYKVEHDVAKCLVFSSKIENLPQKVFELDPNSEKNITALTLSYMSTGNPDKISLYNMSNDDVIVYVNKLQLENNNILDKITSCKNLAITDGELKLAEDLDAIYNDYNDFKLLFNSILQ